MSAKCLDDCFDLGCCMASIGIAAIFIMTLMIAISGGLLVTPGSVYQQDPYLAGVLLLSNGLGVPGAIVIILFISFCCCQKIK